MSSNPLKDHGRAIIETTKDHLVAALGSAPEDGWTAVEWAEAGGLLLDGASFPAVFAHHIAPVLVREGRARVVDEDAGLARYGSVHGAVEESHSAVAAATQAPQVWSAGAVGGELQVDGPLQAAFPDGDADEGKNSPPEDHEGPWIP